MMHNHQTSGLPPLLGHVYTWIYVQCTIQPRKINPASWQPHHVGKSGLPWVERCDHARRANLRPSSSTASANASFLVESSRQRRRSHSSTSGSNLHSNSESTALTSANNGSKSHRELLRADHVFRRLPSAEASSTLQSSQVKKKVFLS
jgi:hypothetical protein